MHPKIVHLFKNFADLQQYLFTKTYLSDAEISVAREKCWEFGTFFPKYFHSESITRKVHELIFDVPLFISKHKTIGRFAEEEGEICAIQLIRN